MTKQEALKLAFKYAKPKIEKGIIYTLDDILKFAAQILDWHNKQKNI